MRFLVNRALRPKDCSLANCSAIGISRISHNENIIISQFIAENQFIELKLKKPTAE